MVASFEDLKEWNAFLCTTTLERRKFFGEEHAHVLEFLLQQRSPRSGKVRRV